MLLYLGAGHKIVALAGLVVKTNKNWTLRNSTPNTSNLQRMWQSMWYLYNANNARAILLQKLHIYKSEIMERKKIMKKSAIMYCTRWKYCLINSKRSMRRPYLHWKRRDRDPRNNNNNNNNNNNKTFAIECYCLSRVFHLNFSILIFWYNNDA